MKKFSSILAVAAILAGCEGQRDPAPERVIINNDSFFDRINYNVDSTVTLGASPGGRVDAEFSLKLRAEVLPPVHEGVTLRASHIYVDDGYAYVVYNLEGEPYLGGVEVFNIKDTRKPFIESQAIFINTDVSSVYYDEGVIYLAEATGDAGFASPAVLESIRIDNGRLTNDSRRIAMTSYATTDVCVMQEKIAVTSGSDGGLFLLNKSDLQTLSFVPLDDARAVAFSGTNALVTLQGTPARVSVYDFAGSLQRSVTLDGATIPASKSNLAMKGHSIFIAAGDGGTYSVNKNTGVVNFNIPAPEGDGLDPATAVCNSVAVFGDMLYMANGEAGLYVAKIHENDTFSDVTPITFSAHSSANHVAVKNRIIFIATGTGGLKIVEIE
ncbi:MAG TPA: hypothetical protein VEB86_15695 [Chryseosolibacter sp.]|nr:hypothetical protein [Chryseosolibacter sp.]